VIAASGATAIASASWIPAWARSTCRFPCCAQASASLAPGAEEDGGEGAHVSYQAGKIADVGMRRADGLVQAVGMSGITKSGVSKLSEEIAERVNASSNGRWPARFNRWVASHCRHYQRMPRDRRPAYRTIRGRSI